MADVNMDQIIDQLSNLTVMQIADLTKKLEDKWGVKAAPVAVAGVGGAAAAAAAEAAAEQTEFTVILVQRGHQQDPGDQGDPRDHQPGPQGGQGPGRRRAEGDQGRRVEGRGRGHQEEDRRGGRYGRDQVVGIPERIRLGDQIRSRCIAVAFEAVRKRLEGMSFLGPRVLPPHDSSERV